MVNPKIVLCAPKAEIDALSRSDLEAALGAQGDLFVCNGGIASRDCVLRFAWEPVEADITDLSSTNVPQVVETPEGQEAVCLVKKAGKKPTDAQIAQITDALELLNVRVYDVNALINATAANRSMVPTPTDAGIPHGLDPGFPETACALPQAAADAGREGVAEFIRGEGGESPIIETIREGVLEEGCTPEAKKAWLDAVCGAIPAPNDVVGAKSGGAQSPEVLAYIDYLKSTFPDSTSGKRILNEDRPSFSIEALQTVCAYLADNT